MPPVVYHLRFADGRDVVLPAGTDAAAPAEAPDWTRLDYRQCPNCPLSVADTPRCPLALRLVPLITAVATFQSFDTVEVRVETAERSVHKTTTVQRAVGAVMGLLAGGSACPHMGFLKPLAHFHLPFATEEETIYRVASTYLLGQYFRLQQGDQPDWALAGLKASYQELQRVNTALAARLRGAVQQDGAVNGLILLDLLAKALPYSIDEQLEEIQTLFGVR